MCTVYVPVTNCKFAFLFRVKKWYWTIYAWFLNICMVQAWRLYR